MSHSYRIHIEVEGTAPNECAKLLRTLQEEGNLGELDYDDWQEEGGILVIETYVTLYGGEDPDQAHSRLAKFMLMRGHPMSSVWWDDERAPDYEFRSDKLIDSMKLNYGGETL